LYEQLRGKYPSKDKSNSTKASG